MSPGWVKLPKATSAETGEAVVQTHLVERYTKCYVIGYGGKQTSGIDHDGLKVMIPPRNGSDEFTIYSSNDVFPNEKLEMSRDLLTGSMNDALGNGKWVRAMFDVDGTEKLQYNEVKSNPFPDEDEEPEAEDDATQRDGISCRNYV